MKSDTESRQIGLRQHKLRAIAMSASIATATCAYADAQNWHRFENPEGPGHFDWGVEIGAGGPVELDVTRPFDQQGGTSASSMAQALAPPSVNSLTGLATVEVGGLYDLFATDVAANTMIPSGAPFSNGLQAYVYYNGLGSEIAADTATYLGVRFDLGAGFQYGWIGVTRIGMELDAFAWGYSDIANDPIPAGIPEPGSLAMLACGATALLARRRR